MNMTIPLYKVLINLVFPINHTFVWTGDERTGSAQVNRKVNINGMKGNVTSGTDLTIKVKFKPRMLIMF